MVVRNQDVQVEKSNLEQRRKDANDHIHQCKESHYLVVLC